jgi:hypothetical protein
MSKCKTVQFINLYQTHFLTPQKIIIIHIFKIFDIYTSYIHEKNLIK